VSKFCHDGGLGISLEGNIDIGNGMEVRPHHYINSILPNGPVGRNGLLKKGDELLEVGFYSIKTLQNCLTNIHYYSGQWHSFTWSQIFRRFAFVRRSSN